MTTQFETNAAVGTGEGGKVPTWVEVELFEDVLRKMLPNFKSIINFKTVAGTTAGENYATVMLRVEIDVELVGDEPLKTLSFMLKVPLNSKMYREMLKENNIFIVEREMYAAVVPELERLYAEVGLNVKFGAQSYAINAPDEYVLLEDLRPKGFKNANRLEGLDVTHVHCVLKKLAQWHAASAVRVAAKGPYTAKLAKGFFKEENRALLEEMNSSLSKYFLKCLETYKGHETYIEQVKNLQPKIGDVLLKLLASGSNDFMVLNHGDCWLNNIMFQYDAAGEIKETYFVDYQMPLYGSVSFDLLYFLLSSVQFEDKLSKFDANIKYYHDALVAHLKLLNYMETIPTLRDIHVALIKNGIWGYCTTTGVMAAVLVDPTEIASLENFLSDSDAGADFKMLMYSNPRYCKHMEMILPWLLNRGAMEV